MAPTHPSPGLERPASGSTSSSHGDSGDAGSFQLHLLFQDQSGAQPWARDRKEQGIDHKVEQNERLEQMGRKGVPLHSANASQGACATDRHLSNTRLQRDSYKRDLDFLNF